MNKYEIVYNFLDQFSFEGAPAEYYEVLEELRTQGLAKEKPLLTDSGLELLEYLQQVDSKNLKASDIAQGMDISSRKVNGAIRKLVTDGFVQKFGQNPVNYSLTEKGKQFDLEKYKETMNDEKDN